MNLKIYGDLPYFYQWDLERKLIVEDGGVCSQVHFCNGTAEALVCLVRDEGDIRVVDVPNILLQQDAAVRAYLYTVAEDGTRTRSVHRFPVIARSRPAEYVYTETEALNYAYLDKRLQDLEGEGLANAVAEYLKENPVEAGATAEEAEQIRKNKQDIENLTADKLSADALPVAVNEALAEAKASGQFDGKDGYTPVKGVDYFDGQDGKDGVDGKDGYTPQKGIDYFDGKDGKDGQNGSDYVLTDADKQEIAEQAAGLVEIPAGGGFVASDTPPEDTSLLWVDTSDNSGSVNVPTDEHINALIDAKLGVIENGTY